jgi:hypothetical protein
LWYVTLLKKQGLHPYHVQRVQALQPKDYIRQEEFCEWVIQKCVDQPDFLRIVLFTDEAGFTRNGVLNSHNTHIQQHIRDYTANFARVRDNLHRRAQACIRNHGPHFEQFF